MQLLKYPYNFHIDKNYTKYIQVCKYEGTLPLWYSTYQHTDMLKNIDFYLGVFLILSGIIICITNLRSVLSRKYKYSVILLSQNIILICIGITFIIRAVYSLNPENFEKFNSELRTVNITTSDSEHIYGNNKCGFLTLLISYGPLIVSMVNSFLSLIIDNYMHYQMIMESKKLDKEHTGQEINENSRDNESLNKMTPFFKHNFSKITVVLQWILPVVTALSMYSMNVKQISMEEARKLEGVCMTTLDFSHRNCLNFINHNNTELNKIILSPTEYLETDLYGEKNSSMQIESILDNVLKIIKSYNNRSDFQYTSIKKSLREPKLNENCMKVCITDNKSLLLYMFLIACLCYFIPITISAVILTKINITKTKKPHLKTYVTRELIYNILFWTPVIFDTFFSLILCSFSMNGVRTSTFQTIANLYQAVKNFMNTKHFKENIVVPM